MFLFGKYSFRKHGGRNFLWNKLTADKISELPINMSGLQIIFRICFELNGQILSLSDFLGVKNLKWAHTVKWKVVSKQENRSNC